MAMPIVLDCDNTLGAPRREIADGMALLYLLGSGAFQLLGITTTFGDGPVELVHRQTRRLLERLGREEIPVFRGEAERARRPTAAAHFLARAARERPGELTVVATGPLGNLHAAAALARGFFSQIRQVVCSGGLLAPARVGWRPLVERNFSAAPEAAHAVLTSRGVVTVISGQLGLQAPFSRRELRRLRSAPPWLERAVRRRLWGLALHTGHPRIYLGELLPAVFLARPELFEARTRYCVSSPDELGRGRLVFSERATGAMINVPSRIRSHELLMDLLLGALDRLFAGLRRE